MYALSYDMQAKPRPSEAKPWLKYFSPEAVAAPLPHTAVGKIDYRRLEDDYEREHCA